MSYYDIVNLLDQKRKQEEEFYNGIYKKIKTNIVQCIRNRQNECIFGMETILLSVENKQNIIDNLIARLNQDHFNAQQINKLQIRVSWNDFISKQESKIIFDGHNRDHKRDYKRDHKKHDHNEENDFLDDNLFIDKIAKMKQDQNKTK